jgi:putative phage-type endonuclease
MQDLSEVGASAVVSEETKQRTDEWHAARLGCCTGSRVHEVIAKTRSGYSSSRANYASELVCERLTGRPIERYRSRAMEVGTELEPEARSLYSLLNDVEVTEIGFVRHPHIDKAGCSPDGLIGENGLIEIKCPLASTHLQTLLSDSMDGRYLTQVQFQMATTGRQWCDLVSYCPDLPADMQMWTRRIPRDDSVIRDLEAEVSKFLAEVSTTVSKLLEKYGRREAA